MKSNYTFIIVRHPLDGIRLALKTTPEGVTEPLVILTHGGISCAMAHGFTVPREYLGVAGLLQFKTNQLSVQLKIDDKPLHVVFPVDGNYTSTHYAEIYDRLREKLSNYNHVTVILNYDRLDEDLPPLQPEDQLACFWEARDHLSDEMVDKFQYLVERVEAETPRFYGLCVYNRNASYKDVAEKRLTNIRSVLKKHTLKDLVHL